MDKSKVSTDFLLSEFNHIRDIWKHIDSRTESAIRQYFTVLTILLSGIAFTYDKYSDLVELNVLIIIVLSGSASFSFLVLRRILQTTLRKIEYFNAMNSIRSYFIDRDLDIRSYVVLPTRNLGESRESVVEKYEAKTKSFSVRLFTFWVSIQLSILSVLSTNILINSGLFLTVIGILSLLIFFVIISALNKKLMKLEVSKVDNMSFKDMK